MVIAKCEASGTDPKAGQIAGVLAEILDMDADENGRICRKYRRYKRLLPISVYISSVKELDL